MDSQRHRGRNAMAMLFALCVVGATFGGRAHADGMRWRMIGPFRGGRTRASPACPGGRASSTSAP